MESTLITVVYHTNCKASTDFLIEVSKLKNAQIEYINIKEDKIETSIEVDVVPLMIVNNDPSKIFKGKNAFDKLEELILKEDQTKYSKKSKTNLYEKKVSFIEDNSGKKEKIDLGK